MYKVTETLTGFFLIVMMVLLIFYGFAINVCLIWGAIENFVRILHH